MSGASTQRTARRNWVTPYAFELLNGGLGVSLACTTSSASAALVGEGQTIVVTNVGYALAFLAIGSSTVTATTSYMPIQPGPPYVFTIPEQDAATTTHVAGITSSGSTTLVINRGHGA